MHDLFDLAGQGPTQLVELALAFLLSALVGLEREWRQKSAGLRTNTLVGVSAALFVLISKYGFSDVLAPGRIVVDPSRVAAQIVSGIGFIGGGVIFMRRNAVRGLTTAASVWLTAALGMACGAGLPVLAVATTIGHFIIMFVFPKLARLLPRQTRVAVPIRIVYEDGRGLLRAILIACTRLRFTISHVDVEREGVDQENTGSSSAFGKPLVSLCLRVKGGRTLTSLIAALSEIDGVIKAGTIDSETDLD